MSDEPMNVIVSVIIPVYNAAKYISGTLDTILSQSLKDIEIIIVNDNSTDNTLDVITQIASEDSRVRIINNPLNVGEVNPVILVYAKLLVSMLFSLMMMIMSLTIC